MRLWETYFRNWDRMSGILSTKQSMSRNLWETYFRIWERIGGSLPIKQSLSEKRRKFLQDEERVQNYYGYLCDKDVCIGV